MNLIAVYEIRDEAVIVSMAGEVDLRSADRFRIHLQAGLDAAAIHPHRLLILDLRGVGFFGSSALRALAERHPAATDIGVSVGVVCEDSNTLRLMQIARLDEVYALDISVGRALRSLMRGGLRSTRR